MTDNIKTKYLPTAKKLVTILEDIDKLDKKIEKKYEINTNDLEFYIKLQETTGKYYIQILKNLKDTV